MKNIINKLNSFWFTAIAPERIAIVRIITGLFSLWYLTTRFSMMQRIAKSSTSKFEPVGIVSFLESPLSIELFNWILYVTLVLNVLYIIGLKYRFIGPAFGLAFLVVMCYRNSWGMVYHNYNILVLHIFVIGMVAAADKLSVDAWLKGKKVKNSHNENDWQYGWPIRLLSSITVGSYILAGLAKVMGELTWGWIDGSAMRSQVAVDALRKEMFGGAATPLFEFLYPYTILFTIMGIVSLVLELGAFIALTNKHIGIVWALVTCSMHWGILFIMGIDFPYHYSGIIFLSFFPLEKAWFMLRRLLSQKREVAAFETSHEANSIVLFDGVCNFCNASVRFIIDRDYKNVFQFTSIQSETGQALLKEYNAPNDLSTIVLIDKELGKVYTKSSAILYIAKYLKAPWFLFFGFIIVPKPLRDLAYTIFAKNRYRWFGQKDVCEIPSMEVQSRFL